VRLCSFGGYGLALAALALVVFGAIECPPQSSHFFRPFFGRGGGTADYFLGPRKDIIYFVKGLY